MSTTVGRAPAASARESSESISAADTPCGAAASTAERGSRAASAAASSWEENGIPPSTGARCGNAAATGSPGWLSEAMAVRASRGWPATRRTSSPAT